MLLIFFIFNIFHFSQAVDNTQPRKDVLGQLMDVHDGNIIKVGNLYHWYGMGYTNCTLETGTICLFDSFF